MQVNSAPARGPDHFPFQGFRDSGIGSQGITNSLEMMVKTVRSSRITPWLSEVSPACMTGCAVVLSQGVSHHSLCPQKTTVLNLPKPSYTMG